MIKSRCHHIELGEIASVLYQRPSVVETAGPDEEVGNRILTCVTVNGETGSDELLRHCGECLSRYVAPEGQEILDSLPRASTGKIDRKSLTG